MLWPLHQTEEVVLVVKVKARGCLSHSWYVLSVASEKWFGHPVGTTLALLSVLLCET